jgi:hypothetical protein
MSDNNNTTGLEVLGLLALAIASIFYKYFVVIKVWNIVAVKLGARPITTFTEAFCLCTLASVIYGINVETKKRSNEEAVGVMLKGAVFYSLAWAISYWIMG